MSDRVSVSATTVWLEEWRREASLHVGGMHLAPRMPRAVDNGCCGLSLSWRKVNGGGVLFGRAPRTQIVDFVSQVTSVDAKTVAHGGLTGLRLH